MVNNSDIYIHFISIFLILMFVILYTLNVLISKKINFYYKIISLFVLFIIINMTFNLISKNLLYYRKFFCNFNKKSQKKYVNTDSIITPYNDSNFAKY
jgi:hypothetical protein